MRPTSNAASKPSRRTITKDPIALGDPNRSFRKRRPPRSEIVPSRYGPGDPGHRGADDPRRIRRLPDRPLEHGRHRLPGTERDRISDPGGARSDQPELGLPAAGRRLGNRDSDEPAEAQAARLNPSSRSYALTHFRIALSETPYLR